MPVRSNFRSEVVAKLQAAKGGVKAARSAALDEVGVRVLSWTWQEYRKKARGGSDVWGQRWKPIKLTSIGGRLLRRAVGRPVLRRMRRGAAYRKVRAAILYRACTDPKFEPRFYAAVQAEYARHEIGVDTGRQINGLQFGKPGNVVQKADASITLGVNLRYSGWFDRMRPIFPPDLTAGQKAEIQRIAAKHYMRAIEGK